VPSTALLKTKMCVPPGTSLVPSIPILTFGSIIAQLDQFGKRRACPSHGPRLTGLVTCSIMYIASQGRTVLARWGMTTVANNWVQTSDTRQGRVPRPSAMVRLLPSLLTGSNAGSSSPTEPPKADGQCATASRMQGRPRVATSNRLSGKRTTDRIIRSRSRDKSTAAKSSPGRWLALSKALGGARDTWPQPWLEPVLSAGPGPPQPG
jgi:hypothetical protein